jgi:hypothetical protein
MDLHADGECIAKSDDNTDDDIDATDDDAEDYSLPALDPLSAVIELCRIAANPKASEAVLKRIRRAERAATAAEQKCEIAQAKLEQRQAALDVRTAELDERERVIAERETAFEDQVREGYDNLRAYYNEIRQADRSLRYRVLALADLLHGYNPTLQDLPDWPEIQRTIGLPVDPPPAPPAEQEMRNVRHDWAGSVFSPDSTVTRTITASE